jgi:hypothetical protein
MGCPVKGDEQMNPAWNCPVQRHTVEEMVVVARDQDRRTARRHMMKAGDMSFEAAAGEAISDQAHHAMHDYVVNSCD